MDAPVNAFWTVLPGRSCAIFVDGATDSLTPVRWSPRLTVVVTLAVGPVVMAGTCRDEAVRSAGSAVRTVGDAAQLDRAREAGEDVARALRSAPEAAVARASDRVEDVVERFAGTDQQRDALRALTWNVGCDVVGGSIPPLLDPVATALARRSAEYALSLGEGSGRDIAEEVLDAVGPPENRADAIEACRRISEPGP